MPYKCRQCGKEMNYNALYCSKDCQEAAKQPQSRAVTTGCHTVTAKVRLNAHEYPHREGAAVYGPSPAEYIEGGHCVVCKTPFEGLHQRSKTTCSPACRKALSRYRARMDTNFARALDIVDFFADVMEIEDHSERAITALRSLQAAIDSVLNGDEM